MKYKAFISYSDLDREFANWLHNKLENYKVPNSIVGKLTEQGEIKRSLGTIFFAPKELNTTPVLSEALKSALRESEFLIVICSRNSVVSEWVEREVLYFKQIHGEQNVIAIVVDGKPYTDDENECLPSALKYAICDDGSIGSEKTDILAADVRKDKDGKTNAFLKVVSQLIGVQLDELVRRQWQRRKKHYFITTCLLFVVLFSVFEYFEKVKQANDAVYQTEIQKEMVKGIRQKWFKEGLEIPPLFKAIVEGNVKSIKQLIKNGANVNQLLGSDGLSPLMIASQLGSSLIVELLIEANADVYLPSNNATSPGLTAIHITAESGHSDILNVYFNHGYDLDQAVYWGPNPNIRPIDVAAVEGNALTEKKIIGFRGQN